MSTKQSNRFRDRRRWVPLILFLSLLLASCGTEEPEADSSDDEATTPVDEEGGESEEASPGTSDSNGERHDELVLAIPFEPPTLEAAWGYQAQTGAVIRQIFEPLIDRHPETNEFVPALATEWEQLDERTWQFSLREGVTYHDGSAFDAEAAAYAINWHMDPENEQIGANRRSTIRFAAEVVDEYVINVVTEEPKALLFSQLFTLPLASARQLQEDVESHVDDPIGTGPYRFIEHVPGSHYLLEANDDWWGSEQSEDAYGEINFDQIRFIIRPEVQSLIASMQANEASFAWDLPAEECLSELGDECVTAPNPTVSFVRLDTTNPVLGDNRIKEAIALAIDKESIGEALLGGSPPAGTLDTSSAFGFNPDIEPFPYDPGRAEALVEEARADGVPVDETPLRLLGRVASFAGDEQVLEAVQAQLAEVGLAVEAEMLETPVFNDLYLRNMPVDPERGMIALMRWPNDIFSTERTVKGWVDCDGVDNQPHTQAPIAVECFERTIQLSQELWEIPISNVDGYEAKLQEIAEVMFKDLDVVTAIPLNELNMFHGVDQDLVWQPRLDLMLYVKQMDLAS